MPRVEIDGRRYIPLEESNAAAVKLAAAAAEREEVVTLLRGMWEEYDWGDYPSDIHLADVIREVDKRLAAALG